MFFPNSHLYLFCPMPRFLKTRFLISKGFFNNRGKPKFLSAGLSENSADLCLEK
jgi:hypothetical protein